MKWCLCRILFFIVITFLEMQKVNAVNSYDRCTATMTELSVGIDGGSGFSSDPEGNSPGKARSLCCNFRNNGMLLDSENANRIQRVTKQAQRTYLRLQLFYCPKHEMELSQDRERLFPATCYRSIVSSCKNFVFALRKIVI